MLVRRQRCTTSGSSHAYHFCKSYCGALSVALTPHLEVYRPKDFDDCRRDGGSIVACCRLAGGYLNQDATKCMASYLFRGPSQSDGGGEEPASPPRAPTQSAPQ